MSSFEKDMRHAVEFIQDRLYFVALSSPPPSNVENKHFFSIDNKMVYWNFYLDFGPLNLAHVYRYCAMINSKLNDANLAGKTIIHYSHTHAHKRTNAAFLMCCWALLCDGRSPEDAFKPFRNYPVPFPPWHDATPSPCSFVLTILDTLRGLQRAREHKFFDFNNFNIEEYEHFEQVENGDLNWALDGKFTAFAGPHADREFSAGGYYTHRPDDYVPYFKKRNVTLVVRLNKSYYDAKRFTNHGIDHVDMYFLDGSNPPDHILARFLQRSEETPGAVAVHCKAGLGRTGSCIGSYMMKHYRLTAEETIGWLRIVRPGSVIGPQQQFLKDIQQRMWREGDIMRNKVQTSLPMVGSPTPSTREGNGINSVSSSRPSTSQSRESSGTSVTATAPTTPLVSRTGLTSASGSSSSRTGKLTLNTPSSSTLQSPTPNGSAFLNSPGSPDRNSRTSAPRINGASDTYGLSSAGSSTKSSSGSTKQASIDFRTPPVSPKMGSNRELQHNTTLSSYFRSSLGSGKSTGATAAVSAQDEVDGSQGDLLRQRRALHKSDTKSGSATPSMDLSSPNSPLNADNGITAMNSPGSPSRPSSRLGSLLGSWK
jgi:cell division cycle 14